MKTGPTLFKELVKQKQSGMHSMAKYAEILGEEIPDIPLNRIGRFRLQNVLRRKFGVDWKNHGISQKILNEFDTKMKVEGFKNG